ncbi:hypothetical protein K435DRAFT_804280 [Dendrothele bispora CBS 962.96]|uniref:Uncharacterized protein n=1 Tax=Dendrothele bispora (strain CBS 962.96) TaxID=1314807 RepID=A0A4S8LEU5_DENBC|nr:hypothetical protein K435DRAFT_804280 [Dendrothele bispora CBS 962.96]
MTARYNHFPGDDRFNPIPLMDNSKPAKAVLALGRPTLAPKKMDSLWYNQLYTAVGMRSYDRKWENETGGNQFVIKEFVKNRLQPNSSDVKPDTLVLTGPAMYMVPPQGSSDTVSALEEKPTGAVAPRNRMKRRRIEEDPSSDSNAITNYSDGVSQAQSSDDMSSSLRVYPTGDQIFVGATYDPRLQHDYGGIFFNQNHARLVQPDFRDVTQKLICPWDFYDKLRPGTLVLANIDIVVYVVGNKKPKPYQVPKPVPFGPSADTFNNFELPDFSNVPDSLTGLSSEQQITEEATPVPSVDGKCDAMPTDDDSPDSSDIVGIEDSSEGSFLSSSSDTLEEIPTISIVDEKDVGGTLQTGELDVPMHDLDLCDVLDPADDVSTLNQSRGKGKKTSKGKRN